MAVECKVEPRRCFFCKNGRGDQHVCQEVGGGTFTYHVCCFECGARGPKQDTPEQAAEDWNKVANVLDPLPTMTEMRQQTFASLKKGDKVGLRGVEYEVEGRKPGNSDCLRVKTVSGNVFIIREFHWVEAGWRVVERAEKAADSTQTDGDFVFGRDS